MAKFETLLYEERDAVAYVTMNRPDVHNAFNRKMQAELKTMWTEVRRNDDVRVVVLTGAGDEAFCAGIDRNEVIANFVANGGARDNGVGSVSIGVMFDDVGRDILPKKNDFWKPVVAAVNGIACAGALYLLGECDVLLASDNATFFDPHVSYGMVSSFEAMHLLQKAPLGEVLRLVLMGAHERMSAERAREIGLVSEVVPQADLLDRAAWVAECIASASPAVIQATLQATWTAHELGRQQALALAHSFVKMGTTFDSVATGQETFNSGARIGWQLR